ncbi:MAG: hypothetical protein OIN83_08295 [Candidatus Methanoperedens sp.]|nr:hypothetical protein [Candidatus Methanoperedens sp.]
MIDYLLISVLVGLFLLAFLIAGSMAISESNVVQVQGDEIIRIDDTKKSYIFFGSEEKEILYNRLIRQGCSESEALKFIS